MDLLLSRLDDCLGPLAEPVRGHLESLPGGAEAQGALLRLAALLHDAAKPDCARLIGGRLRFFGHEEAGAKAAEAVLRRLRFSREEREAVSEWIRHHLRPGNLAANEAVSDRAVYRFFRDLKGQGIRQLLLCWADHASYLDEPELLSILGWACEDPHAFRPPRAIPEETAKTLRHLQVIAFLLSRWFLEPETVRPKRILDGNDVMKALGLPPGPAVGEILSELEEAQATGRVRTREEALRFVSGRIPPPG
jgi:tRNA nucleotidyltransferase/poly(A) polymerase